MAKPILELEDVKLLVYSFYDKVREDTLLSPIFNKVIEDRWPKHLEKMVQFWQTILLDEHTYYGAPFAPHAHLPIEGEHFERWLALFYQTIDAHFVGEKAMEAKWRADKMAQMFQLKLAHFRGSNMKPIV